jgi:Uma2 family endonuclease
MTPKLAAAEPVWEIARLFPPQGYWSLDHYLTLDAGTNHLIEFSDGVVEILPMPSIQHQRIVRALFHWLYMFVQQHSLGEVFFAPTKVELWENKIREPNVFFVSNANLPHHTDQWFQQIDLAIEVISPDDPNRDLETKWREYAQAGISEYWIVDPRNDTVTVLTLSGGRYVKHGVFGKGDCVSSVLLPSFSLELTEQLW